MPSSRRKCLPVALTLVGVWILVGCVYIPVFDTTVRGRKADKDVGAERSDKPVRVNRATLADVTRVLGEPRFATADRTVVAYPWAVRKGYMVWPLCFTGTSVYGHRTLVLRFDEQQVLRSFEVLKRDESIFTLDGGVGPDTLPPEIRRELADADRRRRRASARPTAVPQTAPVSQPE